MRTLFFNSFPSSYIVKFTCSGGIFEFFQTVLNHVLFRWLFFLSSGSIEKQCFPAASASDFCTASFFLFSSCTSSGQRQSLWKSSTHVEAGKSERGSWAEGCRGRERIVPGNDVLNTIGETNRTSEVPTKLAICGIDTTRRASGARGGSSAQALRKQQRRTAEGNN